MDKIFILKFAVKNLRFRLLRTMLTLGGIAVGISSIVFLAAFTFGLENLVTQSISGGDAFTYLDVGIGNSQIVKINDETVKKIAGLQSVGSVEKSVSVPAKAKVTEVATDISFYGTSAKYLNWSNTRIDSGQSLTTDDSKVLVNTAFLKILSGDEENIGKKIKLDIILPKELTGSESASLSDQEFEIAGIVKDETGAKVYANIGTLSDTGLINFNQLKVEIKDRDEIDRVRKSIENMGLTTEYIGDTVDEIQSVFGVFRLILISFGLLALVVAVMGMFNTLTISLMERIKEVALLKVFGISRRNLKLIFWVESSLFGVLGGLLGILCGVLLGSMANSVVNHYALRSGGDAVGLFYYPVGFIVLIFFSSFLVGFLTGIYPAHKAIKVDTLDVLRYE